MRVAIVTDEGGWHTRRLRQAFQRRGVDCRCLRLQDCHIDLDQPHGLYLPGFTQVLPAAVLVRGVPDGSFQQVTFRLTVLHALRELGVPVYNDARCIERSVDKGMTSLLLHRAGVPTPATWVGESQADARRVLLEQTAHGNELVVKPLFGSEGKGLQRIGFGAALPDLASLQGVAYLQRFVPGDGTRYRDWRVLVAGSQALAAMRRESDHWITNVAQGAKPLAQPLDQEPGPRLAQLAICAARALQMDYAGVDIVRACSGELLVLEVNGVPAWRGLQSVSEHDLAQALVDDLLGRRMQDHATPERHARLALPG